ncbi:thioredoxin-dependent thiol peroxidase [Chryseobacterium sp.]|uniref:thioredoxin-dependent thiol peroxidase n=1 Tax=Chryseobacterium sp. TaxID=1871047 RepID=UPI0011C9CE8F|nr:thioredoxin-dependent thiol peroxidase [Chryseobacterium sp.]TXF76059.1 thioredoxin-dependent thiol peroxidase [Chryseobacterium sp.]
MLKVGDALPKFESMNQEGEILKSSDFSGKKLVIFFYPQANTPTCTVEACNLSDNFPDLTKEGFQVIGISGDSVKKQKNFHAKFNLKYDLLADENHHIIDQFGVWQEKSTFGKKYMGIVRTTFIFDENGICTRVISKVRSKEAAQQILEN